MSDDFQWLLVLARRRLQTLFVLGDCTVAKKKAAKSAKKAAPKKAAKKGAKKASKKAPVAKKA